MPIGPLDHWTIGPVTAEFRNLVPSPPSGDIAQSCPKHEFPGTLARKLGILQLLGSHSPSPHWRAQDVLVPWGKPKCLMEVSGLTGGGWPLNPFYSFWARLSFRLKG